MSVFQAHDEQRRRWARRLHTTAAQQLAALRLDLGILEKAQLNDREARALNDAVMLAETSARELQQVIAELHPPLLDTFGLVAALRELAARQGTELKLEGIEESLKLAPEMGIAVYRIFEQARARRAEMRMEGDVVVLRFEGARGEVMARVVEVGSASQDGDFVTVRISECGTGFSL